MSRKVRPEEEGDIAQTWQTNTNNFALATNTDYPINASPYTSGGSKVVGKWQLSPFNENDDLYDDTAVDQSGVSTDRGMYRG